jgi:hypothetical protein
MTTIVYMAIVGYEGAKGSPANSIPIGVFSSEEKARAALEGFKEGTLNMQFPDAQITSESVEDYVLDQVLGADDGSEDQLPF